LNNCWQQLSNCRNVDIKHNDSAKQPSEMKLGKIASTSSHVAKKAY
jgi:hypothetical protein